MMEIPSHPFELGAGWNRALAGDAPDWDQLFDGYVAAVDWPASMFWRELSEANPDALVLAALGALAALLAEVKIQIVRTNGEHEE